MRSFELLTAETAEIAEKKMSRIRRFHKPVVGAGFQACERGAEAPRHS
jgi:hypothetical protein